MHGTTSTHSDSQHNVIADQSDLDSQKNMPPLAKYFPHDLLQNLAHMSSDEQIDQIIQALSGQDNNHVTGWVHLAQGKPTSSATCFSM